MDAASSTERAGIFARVWDAFDAGQLIPTCAWCGRVRIGGTWLLVPRAALAAIDQRLALSHSICQGCVETLDQPRHTRTSPGHEPHGQKE